MVQSPSTVQAKSKHLTTTATSKYATSGHSLSIQKPLLQLRTHQFSLSSRSQTRPSHLHRPSQHPNPKSNNPTGTHHGGHQQVQTPFSPSLPKHSSSCFAPSYSAPDPPNLHTSKGAIFSSPPGQNARSPNCPYQHPPFPAPPQHKEQPPFPEPPQRPDQPPPHQHPSLHQDLADPNPTPKPPTVSSHPNTHTTTSETTTAAAAEETLPLSRTGKPNSKYRQSKMEAAEATREGGVMIGRSPIATAAPVEKTLPDLAPPRSAPVKEMKKQKKETEGERKEERRRRREKKNGGGSPGGGGER